ncbi:two-component system response regulator NarL [Reinekea blandensis]|uniref:Two-component response regulator NarL n=1 Tax=Reinekea blandensis MED297 TaxID=314283 RepID=A4BGQ4_9GAMM|nr:two-component system response regulator NarL [Reinekea blandensis]EAR08702.1 two-component response regulator NarL [Reinekea sp. MED297] [Reinekea blandensis MED297]
MTDIIIIDDHPMLRKGLSQLLDLEDDLHLVAEVGEAQDAVRIVTEHEPDLILLDLNMPGQDGLQTLNKLRDAGVDARIIVFTVSDDQADIHRAIHNGADGYLLKDIDPEEFLESIKRCMQGEQVVSPGIQDVVRSALSKRLPENLHPALRDLTDREKDVLRLIAAGLPNKSIGQNLDIAEGTVKVHVKRVLSKLGLRSRVEAAIFAHEHAREL